jgi:hypothetical protein
MTIASDSKMRFGGWLAATLLAPIFIISVELLFEDHFNVHAAGWYYAGFALSLIAGLFCLWRLPLSITKRAWLTVAFVPVGTALLWFYSLLFVCAVLGDCP